MPQISVIVPVYKAETFLHRCVDSILAQTFHNFEVLLIDDGSPDNSCHICDEYAKKDSRVRVFHKKNGGVSSARNFALDIVAGEFLIFIDSDDWIDTMCLEDCIRCFKNSTIDLLQFDSKIINLDGSIQYSRNLEDTILSNIDYVKSNKFNVSVWGNVFRKSIINTFSVRFDETMKLGEDQKFVFNVMEHCSNIQSITTPYYNYFQNVGSTMHNTKNEDLIHCACKMADLKNKLPIFTSRCDLLILNHICILIGRPGLMYKDVESLYRLVNKDYSLMPTKLLNIAKYNFRMFYWIIKIGKIIRNHFRTFFN